MNWLDSVNQHMTVDETLRRYPVVAELFEEWGFPESCRDCALAAMAHRMRMEPQDLVGQVNRFLAAAASRERSG